MARRASIEEDFFLMANLSPLFTGLPFVVWISPRGNARHDIRVKISPGQKAIPEKLFSVALRPEVRVLGPDRLEARELGLLREWVDRNWDVLIAYWNGEIFTEEAVSRLRPVGER
ncbi:MAG: hypothetical protein JO051_07960 [Acidobacteriaceae bacterium]|nr:hypothetical protein [Acidobacteriaceae bacterium]